MKKFCKDDKDEAGLLSSSLTTFQSSQDGSPKRTVPEHAPVFHSGFSLIDTQRYKIHEVVTSNNMADASRRKLFFLKWNSFFFSFNVQLIIFHLREQM